MKLNVNCEEHKPVNKNGVKDKCNCKHLNRNFHRELKLWRMFMKDLNAKR